jgi:MFS family permease
MITASTDAEHFSRAIGFHRSADTLGAVIGPIFALIGLSLLDGDVRAVMWWAVLPAMASIALSLLIRESPAVRVPPGLESQLPLPRSFWVAAGPLIAVQLVNLPDTLLLLRLSELGASTTQVVLAYIAFNAVYTLAAYPAGAIAANLRPARVYAVGLAAFAVAYMGLGIATSATPAVFLLVALYGMFPALTDGIGKSMVAHSAPRSIHGKVQGVYQSLAGAGILIAGTWGGLAWHGGHGGGSVPFLVAGVSGAVAALYFTVAKRYRPS